MANYCPNVLQGCALRVARLEADGVPLPGAKNLYVTQAMTKVTFTENLEKGEDVVLKNACGNICAVYKGPDLLKYVDVTLDICAYDPELFELIRGGSVVTSGTAEGYMGPRVGVDPQPAGVSIEVWCKRIINGAPDPIFPYEHFAFPRCHFAAAQRTIENAFMVSTFNGYGIENANWEDGPTDDWPVATPLVACYGSIPTTTLPPASCGYQTLAST